MGQNNRYEVAVDGDFFPYDIDANKTEHDDICNFRKADSWVI